MHFEAIETHSNHHISNVG